MDFEQRLRQVFAIDWYEGDTWTLTIKVPADRAASELAAEIAPLLRGKAAVMEHDRHRVLVLSASDGSPEAEAAVRAILTSHGYVILTEWDEEQDEDY